MWVLALAFLAAGNVPICADDTRPNVILILADDLGYADVGVYRAKDFSTPNLDRLAREGVRLHGLPRRAGGLLGVARGPPDRLLSQPRRHRRGAGAVGQVRPPTKAS